MVALVPFGPVAFVYDVGDTEGENLPTKEMFWWEEKRICFDERVIAETIKNCKNIGINVHVSESGMNFIRENSLRTMGLAIRHSENLGRKIVLHPRYLNKSRLVEEYGVLCHEIAHHLLGHLGTINISVVTKRGKENKKIAAGRDIPRHICELEAELAAWIVFNKWGIDKNSTTYMALWFMDQKDVEKIDMSEVLRAANKIKEMGTRMIRW